MLRLTSESFRLEGGVFSFHDNDGNTITADQRLVAERTYRKGNLMRSPERVTEVPGFLNMGNPWQNYD